MHRLKIFILTSIVLIALLGLTISFNTPIPTDRADRASVVEKTLVKQLDPNEVALYKWRQEELRSALEAYFNKAIAAGSVVGAGVSIVNGDSIVLSEGFGKRNKKSEEKVDGQTIFRLGSLSKGFAGILAANIVNEGKLKWEDKVVDFIPQFRLGDKSNSEKITLANIMSHTSGAPYHSFTNLIEAGLPLSDIAERFKEVKPISDPGELYSYQNALYALSGEIIFKATGEDISSSLVNRIFKPLGMSSVSMDYTTLAQEENVALPHVKWRNSWRPKKLNDHYYNAIAAGGISANAVDMGKWMRFILGHNPEIMSSAAIKEAFKPVVEIKGRSKYYQRWEGHKSSYYGYGWRIHKFVMAGTNREKTIWHHGGSINNYRNEIALYPEEDLGICVLINSNSRLARTVIPDLYKIVEEVYRQTTIEMASNQFSEAKTDF